MIREVHAMFYTPQAEKLCVFMRDKLQFPFTDTGGGWFIFDAPAAEIGCHPSDRKFHDLAVYCDDLRKTMVELKHRGVEFTSDVREEDWGSVTRFKLPDGDEVELYQPRCTTRHARVRRTIRSVARNRSSRKQ